MLAGTVRGAARVADLAHLGRDGDNPRSMPPFDDGLGKRPAREIGATQVRFDHEVEVVDCLGERRPWPVEPCRRHADGEMLMCAGNLHQPRDVVR